MTQEEIEIQEMQERLAAARKKVELAEQARLEKIRADIAARAAADELRIAREREEVEAINAKWAEKRRLEKENEEAERRKFRQ